ncbi:hypothetical protein [Hydrogenimonas sp.]
MTWRTFISFALAGILLGGCGGSGTSDNYETSDAAGGYVLFSSDTGNIPYPNDILMDPTTGKVHFDTNPSDRDYAVKSALNTLDGFSTTAPITVGIEGNLDIDSLRDRVLMIDIDPNHGIQPPSFVATSTGKKIAIVPTLPLQEANRYLVVLLKGIADTTGKALEPDYVTSLILDSTPLLDENGDPTVVLDDDPTVNLEKVRTLEAIRQHTQRLIAASQIPADRILNIWSFKTQSIGRVARAIAENGANDSYLGLRDTKATSKDMAMAFYAAQGDSEKVAELNATMLGNAEVYAGILANVPYYLGIPTPDNPTAPLTDAFTFENGSNMPVEKGRLTIPVLASIPNEASGCKQPENGWPVVIFQHGITRNRLDVLAISEALARICHAVVGIDLPLHGISDPNNPLYDKEHERTFNLDFLTQDENETILAKVPDGKPDTSGIHYMNLTHLLTVRDNIRQSTSDYIALQNAIMTYREDAWGNRFDPDRISYVGHSLGTIAPFGFFAYQDAAGLFLDSVLLSVPGGGITDIMLHSETFGETVVNGLKEAGLEPGTEAFDAFLNAMQTVLDDADPLNYAIEAAEKQKFLIHMVKDDDVIPNTVSTAPMSGGVFIAHLMGAKDITSYFDEGETAKRVFPGEKEDVYTFFQSGNHRSLFIPDYDLQTTIEMQTEMDSFIASQAMAIDADLSRILH